MYRQPITLSDIFETTPNRIIKNFDDQRYINRQKIIDYFYEIIVEKRTEYLTCFYNSFFDFKRPDKLNWKNTDIRHPDNDDHLSLQKNDSSRVMIRNLYYLEILHLTKITNTMECNTSFWQTFENLYNHLKLEARFFAPSSIGLFLRPKKRKKKNDDEEQHDEPRNEPINYNNLYYLIQAYQPKASILNPYTIHWVLNNVFPKTAKSLFTPVLSWSSYLTAIHHLPQYERYVGLDVMDSVCRKSEFLANYYKSIGFDKSVNIIKCPSEKLIAQPELLPDEKFDSILICPPYFDMEIYPEGEQSVTHYKTYDEWLEKYWRATVELCKYLSHPGTYFGVIINDYYDLDKNFYPLTKDLDKITCEYFTHVNTYSLYNRTSPLRAVKKDRTEKLFVYRI
jgi:hypothetical protein